MKVAVRVLLVYGYQPSGHAAAAFALEEACREAGLLVSRVEVSGRHHRTSGTAVARAYHGLLRSVPGLWGGLYGSAATRSVLRGVRRVYLSGGGAKRLRAGVKREAPDVIVCPQAAVAAVFAEARRRGELDVPVVSVLTDYGVHPFWAEPAADLIIAPSEAAAAELIRLGVPAARVQAAGVPIHAAFSSAPSRAEARRLLALPPSAQVVLVSGGSHGHGGVGRVAAAVLDACPRAFVLALCGANDGLRRALSARPDAGERLRVFGPQPPALVAALLAACDVHAGKPGGLTAAETLAAGRPMVLTRPLPGQEQANASFLLESGAAMKGGGAEATGRVCAELLADRPRRETMGEAALRAARPNASTEIAAVLARIVSRRETAIIE